ncbi:MAG: hypothetical protein ACI8RZ_000775 [Myxococcota bacterium]|jgi:hypothetical protein
MKRGFLARLILVTLAEDPRDLATELIDITLSDDPDDEKAEDIGDVIDAAFILTGPVGSILEGIDGPAVAHLAGLGLALIEETQVRVMETVSDRFEEGVGRMRDRGVPESAIDAMREVLRLDELAA